MSHFYVTFLVLQKKEVSLRTPMSNIELKLKEENEILKELFNLNEDESKLKHLKEIFPNFVRNSKKSPRFLIEFLEFYSKCRPNQIGISRELVNCVYSCFPEQIDKFQQEFKFKDIVKFIIFPEEFPINENKELKEMFLLLQKDDIDAFISFLSNNPTINITKEQKLEFVGYYYYLFDNFLLLFHSLIFVVSLVL